jgi:hypothetical protein
MVGVHDQAAPHASVQDTGPRRGRQVADVAATIVLLVVHFLLFGATIMVLGLLVMTTDACAYQSCGDPVWLDRAINLGIWAGIVVFFLDVWVTLVRLIRKRLAWFVPLLGCVAQLALALGAAAMESLAGPT